MKISKQVELGVPQPVKLAGIALFSNGAVRVLEGDAVWVEAKVKDRKSCYVTLRRVRHRLGATCDCAEFEQNAEICQHIWATVLAADDLGHLQGSRRSLPLTGIEPDDFELEDEFTDEHFDDYDDDDDDEDDLYDGDEPPSREPTRLLTYRPTPERSGWQEQLAQLGQAMQQPHVFGVHPLPAGREILYLIDVTASMQGNGLVVETDYRERKRDGDWSKPKKLAIEKTQVGSLPDPADRQIMTLLHGATARDTRYGKYNYYSSYVSNGATQFTLSEAMYLALVPEMCRTGRCFMRLPESDPELSQLSWDEGGAWEFWLTVAPTPNGKHEQIAGQLRRGDERCDLANPRMVLRGGLVFWDSRAARLDDFGAFGLIAHLRRMGPIQVPIGQKEKLLDQLMAMPRLPRLDLPEDLRVEEIAVAPKLLLKVKAPDRHQLHSAHRLHCHPVFQYDDAQAVWNQPGRGVYQSGQRRLLLRDPAAEQAAADRLFQLGFREAKLHGQLSGYMELAPQHLPDVTRTLLAEGWQVEAEGKVYRRPGNFDIQVISGIDWFELHGQVAYDDTTASLPELLKAVQRGDKTVRLDDGTVGLLPEEWLKKYGLLAGLGKMEDGHLRFSRGQVGFLDLLLAEQPEARWDAGFARARQALRRFDGIKAAKAPAGFQGELRPYQKEGLGWLHFLQRFGFGGCLADDMGLGKTIQVLAFLEARRRQRGRSGPALVVVPRSLVFNWKQEAQRFTPRLRLLDYTGPARPRDPADWPDCDVVLTTYGTLRRDVAELRKVRFDYCILDEAQAIKNPDSESAKAAQLVQADQRLAMSGTPVQNHLGELWSLFEFLNPGLLGSARAFQGGNGRNGDDDTRGLLARALRPFILRRTKDQVAPDLPTKTEQTLYCPLEPGQRKLYDELRDHYRQSLLGRIESAGMKKTTMHILEALLRLRQAACHPGLLDKKRAAESSAKLDMLLPKLTEVIREGHKALVFSQFTSLLAIVKQRLDADKVPYEYLDGRTRDRAARVERFQNDPDCKLFLISLKAGGLGLNLTAAEYVFLLDPWWNPFVEAQAIDRTHRIGQERPVFAYRLIAQDTVEERVLELQDMKRHLADSLINADNSVIRNLTREDVERLLS